MTITMWFYLKLKLINKNNKVLIESTGPQCPLRKEETEQQHSHHCWLKGQCILIRSQLVTLADYVYLCVCFNR